MPKILEDVATAAREARIGRQFMTENRRLVEEGGRKITFPFISRVAEVNFVNEGTTPTEVEATYSTIEVTVTKIGTSIKITQEAIDATRVDIIDQQIREVGERMADFEDWMIMRELYGASLEVTETLTNTTPTNVFSMTTGKILEVKTAVAKGNILSVDYWKGKVETDVTDTVFGSVTYRYSTRSRMLESSTVGTTGAVYIGLVDGRANLALVPRKPDAAILHIDHWSDLAKDERFIDRSKSGEPFLFTGMIGRAAGMEIAVCDHAYPGALICLEAKRDKYLVIKRDLEVKKKVLEEADAYAWYFYTEYMPAVVRDDGIALVFNAAEGSKQL